jgi:thymidylate synthase (FAD)
MLTGSLLCWVRKDEGMSEVNVVWSTPDGEKLIAYMARVSNPKNQDNPETTKLLKYLIKHKHFSPFESVNVCMEIKTTRDIARQILRHRSFCFQELSQRYAEADEFELSECRMQDEKNRQSSLQTNDDYVKNWWEGAQHRVLTEAEHLYKVALDKGIAKEVARKLLPEGLTMSRLYMNGTLRSWLHYISVRTDPSTQKEHREVAFKVLDHLKVLYPTVMEAYLTEVEQ